MELTPQQKAKEMYQSIIVCFFYDAEFRAKTFCINVCNKILSYKGRRNEFYDYYNEVKKELIKLNFKSPCNKN